MINIIPLEAQKGRKLSFPTLQTKLLLYPLDSLSAEITYGGEPRDAQERHGLGALLRHTLPVGRGRRAAILETTADGLSSHRNENYKLKKKREFKKIISTHFAKVIVIPIKHFGFGM